MVRAIEYSAASKPSAANTFALELCISDRNKPLLLAHPKFLPYVVDALLLDEEHPRAGMEQDKKIWCQEHHVECLAQLAMFEPAREALRQDASVMRALVVMSDSGLSAEGRKFAETALLALSDKTSEVVHVEGEQKHVMVSYQWDAQKTVKRLNDSLLSRGYLTWFDLTDMKGSVLDAMSKAVENAEVMLYGCVVHSPHPSLRPLSFYSCSFLLGGLQISSVLTR